MASRAGTIHSGQGEGGGKAGRLPAPGALLRPLDTAPFFERLFASIPAQLAACLAFALILRAGSFGNPNIHVDEAFYFMVGQAMQGGALPYIDIWDRKPPGLFALYWAIAGVSQSVYAYQIAALASAALTAFVINRIAARWTGRQGAMLAGFTYLAMIGPMGGLGGQSPVFYNLPIAGAALLIVRSMERLQRGRETRGLYLAMLLCGIAITIKQTAMFEAAFFGLFACATLLRAGMPAGKVLGVATTSIMLGMLPFALFTAFYMLNGHFYEYWHAMVTSNLAKEADSAWRILGRILQMLAMLLISLGFAIAGLKTGWRDKPFARYRGFVALWLVAAIGALWAVPNFYDHYALPVLVPVAVASAAFLQRRDFALLCAGVLFVWCAFMGKSFDLAAHAQSRESMDRFVVAIDTHVGARPLLIYDGPPWLYAASKAQHVSALSFPHHLNQYAERDVSHIDTSREMARVLDARPYAVMNSWHPINLPTNRETQAMVRDYIARNCTFRHVGLVHEPSGPRSIALYDRCTAEQPA